MIFWNSHIFKVLEYENKFDKKNKPIFIEICDFKNSLTVGIYKHFNNGGCRQSKRKGVYSGWWQGAKRVNFKEQNRHIRPFFLSWRLVES